LLTHGLARVDLPVMLRIHAAWSRGDRDGVASWSERLVAMRETAELRFEDRSMGAALARWLDQLGLARPPEPLAFAAAFAVAAAECRIPADDTAAGYAWAWAELQVAAAVKLVPLGHSVGQRVLWQLGARIDSAVRTAMACDDEDIGMSLPGMTLASALHETQYSRLFRS
jgi:urease accessory protein